MVKVYVLAAFLIVVAASVMAAPIDGEVESSTVAVHDGRERKLIKVGCNGVEYTVYTSGPFICITLRWHHGEPCICRDPNNDADHAAEDLKLLFDFETTPTPVTNTDIKKTTT